MLDLIVKDEEFSSYKDTLSSLESAIESELSALVNILSSVCEEVVVDGDFHENLSTFVAKLSNMQGELSYVTDLADEVANNFVTDVDEIDETIY